MKFSVIHGRDYRSRAPLPNEVGDSSVRPPRLTESMGAKGVRLGDAVYAFRKGVAMGFTAGSGAQYNCAVLTDDTPERLHVIDEEIAALESRIAQKREEQRKLIEAAVRSRKTRALAPSDCVDPLEGR